METFNPISFDVVDLRQFGLLPLCCRAAGLGVLWNVCGPHDTPGVAGESGHRSLITSGDAANLGRLHT